MVKRFGSLFFRLVLSALIINLVLAPILYQRLVRIAYESETELFTNNVRAYSLFLADMLEVEIDLLSEEGLVDVLDRVVLSRETVFARMRGNDFAVVSELNDPGVAEYREDFVFGEHEDATYFTSVPVLSERYGEVRLDLGFDEQPTIASLASVQVQTVVALVMFLGGSLLLASLLALLVTRPLRGLQRASQRIAQGAIDQPFAVDSGILEIRELARDLDDMRARLLRTNTRLIKEVRERDELERARSELESRLRHMQKLETIGTLAGGIAHEFNNVLQPMKLYTELAIGDTDKDSSVRADLMRVSKSIDRARDIVHQILTFSRRSQTERAELLDIVSVVREAVVLARDLFPPSVETALSAEPEHILVFGNKTQIHQLIMNLCSNAYRSLSADTGRIEVRVRLVNVDESTIPPRTRLKPGSYCRVDVIDTGRGMDPVTLDRIFEPFFTTRTPGEGTGLGLSVAHGIVHSHGGDIIAESEVGRGSCFSVYLPEGNDAGREQGVDETLPSNINYVGTKANLDLNRDLIERGEFSTICVSEWLDLEYALKSWQTEEEVTILDLGRSALWDKLVTSKWAVSLLMNRPILVVVPLDAMLSQYEFDWTRINHLVVPFSFRDLRFAVQSMKGDAESPSAGGVR